MFTHPTDDYDFIIHLDPGVLPRYCQNVRADATVWRGSKGKYTNLKLVNEVETLDQRFRPGFDPARLFFGDLSVSCNSFASRPMLMSLQRIYEDSIKLFHDPFGGEKIGCVWDPSLTEKPRPFRVLGGFSSIPVGSGEKVKVSYICRMHPLSWSNINMQEKDKGLVKFNTKAVLAEIERMGSRLVKAVDVQEHRGS